MAGAALVRFALSSMRWQATDWRITPRNRSRLAGLLSSPSLFMPTTSVGFQVLCPASRHASALPLQTADSRHAQCTAPDFRPLHIVDLFILHGHIACTLHDMPSSRLGKQKRQSTGQKWAEGQSLILPSLSPSLTCSFLPPFLPASLPEQPTAAFL
jgi:hypothetical protein